MSKRVALTTLGCKLNQYDSEMMLTQFRTAGYEVVDSNSNPDVCIVNTCAVTTEAERKGRAAIRHMHRENPSAKLLAVGCMSERAKDLLFDLPGIHSVVGNKEKERILDFVDDVPQISVGETSSAVQWTDGLQVKGLLGRVRAHLKIQDGCSKHCTYCIIPRLRGKGRSRSLESILDGARQLIDAGFQEIVLTGVALGTYGMDRDEQDGLVKVLTSLEKLNGVNRIRIGSIEPWAVTKSFLEVVANSDVICPHLHIPFQSCDVSVLRKMNRRYTVSDLDQILDTAFSLRSDWGIGADIITGFPGETEQQFDNTRRFIASSPLSYLHVFPFSSRPDTPATKLPGHLPESVRSSRADELRQLEVTLRQSFREKNLNSIHDVILENRISGGMISGHSRNYLDVSVEGTSDLCGKRVKVQVNNITNSGVSGIILN